MANHCRSTCCTVNPPRSLSVRLLHSMQETVSQVFHITYIHTSFDIFSHRRKVLKHNETVGECINTLCMVAV